MSTVSNARVQLFARDAPSVMLEPFVINVILDTRDSTAQFAIPAFTVIVMVFAQLAQSSVLTVICV